MGGKFEQFFREQNKGLKKFSPETGEKKTKLEPYKRHNESVRDILENIDDDEDEELED